MRSKRFRRGALLVALLVVLCDQAGCTFVSKGNVVVSAAAGAGAAKDIDDEVAVIVGAVVERHGLSEEWSFTRRAGESCTMEKGCTWSRTPSTFPWVSVSSPSQGRVRVVVEARRDLPHGDDEVPAMTREIANALRQRLRDARVVIERDE
jgi:hypothetical protein